MAYPISKISFSCFRTFFENPGQFKDKYILMDESKYKKSPAMIVGSMCHTVVELVLKGIEIEVAMQNAYAYLESIDDNDINFGKTGSREQMLKNFKQGVQHYFDEFPKYGKIISLEESITEEIKDVIDGSEIISPLPFSGKIDNLTEENKDLIMEDYKFVSSFTDEEDPKYVFQAFFYFYLIWKKYGRKPKEARFREIKISKNKDGSSQHNVIVIPYSGEKFEENKMFFWYYISGFLKQIENSDADSIFLYNIFHSYNGAENFRLQKQTILGYSREEVEQTEFTQIQERGEKVIQYMESAKSDKIEDKITLKFGDHGIPLKYNSIEQGYTYDRYLFEPGRGVKMSSVTSLHNELLQALEVEKIRIEAPVKGTKFVGVEVPRTERVFLPLPKKYTSGLIPLGKGIDGEIKYVDLSDANTPHLLVVGKTGSGKSEMLKVVVESMKKHAKLILIDPKRTELVGYKQHATKYIVEDVDALSALAELHNDMMTRYDDLASAGFKDIKEHGGMMKIVVVIEEYAQLRLGQFGKEIENTLMKLVALGRAAGIHIVLSTQRPDTKIITGGLKANISARVCFSVATRVDSQVALDEVGAENLVGKGDMLYKNPGEDTVRLQSFYIPR